MSSIVGGERQNLHLPTERTRKKFLGSILKINRGTKLAKKLCLHRPSRPEVENGRRHGRWRYSAVTITTGTNHRTGGRQKPPGHHQGRLDDVAKT
jgi:hypothetical protein